MNFDSMRFTANGENSPLKDMLFRAMEETGDISIDSMRQVGFRSLERAMDGPMEFRAAAPLMERAQVVVDRTIVEVGMQRLTFVQDLLSEGLVYNLPDPLSVPQLEWYSSNRVGAAQRTMTPSARGENKMPIMLPNRTPIYLTTDTFTLDIRTLKMSQRVGMPLDTNLIAQCTRAVNEAFEDAAINGATTLDGQSLVVAGYSAPGLLNAPNANTKVLTASAWSGATPVGPTVQSEILAMISQLQADLKFGPYNLYIPTSVGVALNYDFKTTSGGDSSIIQRAQEINVGGRTLRVRVTDMMPATKVALVQMTSDVVEIIDGQRPTAIPWTSLDGFTIYNLIMGIMVPRVRSDYNGNSGIVIGTLT